MKKLFTFLLALIAGVGTLFAANSGKCGDNLTWSYDGVDTITDATKDDIIQIEGVVKGDLMYVKNGNNLEIFYSDEFDINNKIIVQNHFTKKGRARMNFHGHFFI